VNPYLAHYYGHLGPPPASRSKLRVFVPLCGKSMDMLWLSQNGYAVVGVEVSEIAVEAFFTENGLPLEKQVQGAHIRYSSGNIEIWQGDFFTLSSEQLGDITDVYDRASLIALPPSMRKDYASKMLELLPAAARVLLVTLTYPQAEMDGPPFSVTEEEVRGLYEPHCSIEKLAVKNTLELEPRFKQKGLTSLYETAYKLKRNT
jgi:thiopurine S-methyltransferase